MITHSSTAYIDLLIASKLGKDRIWVITEMFYPDEVSTAYVMTQIAEELAKDFDVHVICGPSGYDKLTSLETRDLNVKIHRLNTPTFDKNNIYGRIAKNILLSTKMFFKGLFNIKREDTVLVVTNPAFNILGYSFIRLLKKNTHIILVHDVFPENALAAKLVKSQSLKYKFLFKVFNWGYRQADKLIVVGLDMMQIMRKKTTPNQNIEVIQNWADTDQIQPADFSENDLIQQLHLADKIVITFAGNLGRVQGLESFFNSIKLIDNPLIHFLFIGNGAMLPKLKKFVSDHNLNNVNFIDAMPRYKQQIFLNAAHFGLVTLDDSLYGLGVPSKTYNIMAAGKPILFIGNSDSEIASMIEQYDCGYAFEHSDQKKLLDFFNTMTKEKLSEALEKGKKAKILADTIYSREAILLKIKKAVSNV